MTALGPANQVRSARAKLKQDLREGKVRLEQILATPRGYLASAEIFDLLVAVPKIGAAKAGRLLNIARISPSKTVVQLSERQRAPASSSCSAASSGRIDCVRGGSDPGRVTNLVHVPPDVNISADRLC
jgi:hypothetical protein